MKKLLLFLGFLLLAVNANAQINVGILDEMILCDTDSDGYETFDLSMIDVDALNGLDSDDYTVSYHEDYYMAVDNINSLPAIYTNTSPFAQEIYVRVTENNNTDNYDVGSVELLAFTVLPIYTGYYVNCTESGEIATFDLADESTNFSNGCDSCVITFYASQADLDAGTPIANPESYNNITNPQTVLVTVESPNGCSGLTSVDLEVYFTGEMSLDITGQTVTVTMGGDSIYEYILDQNEPQQSNVFEDTPFGSHEITVHDQYCGNVVTAAFEILPPGPEGDSIQDLPEGSTLADIVVEGESIQWYINPGINGMGGDTPLPIEMALIDGSTYYASQTINEAESEERLGVTVNLVLSIDNYAFEGLKYYPNPVTDVITISNNMEINNITVANLLGQEISSKTVNSTSSQIDLAALEQGIYLLTITSGDHQQTIKIIRK